MTDFEISDRFIEKENAMLFTDRLCLITMVRMLLGGVVRDWKPAMTEDDGDKD